MILRYGEPFSLRINTSPARMKPRGSSLLVHLGFLLVFVVSFFFANLYAAQEYLARETPVMTQQLRHRAQMKPEPVQQTPVTAGPRVCLIMDDVGEDMLLLKDLMKIPFPLTVSVLPDCRYSRESAVWAHARGFEIMLHMPMQPDLYPQEDPGKDALLVYMSRNQVLEKTQNALAEIPYVVGVNNHMGSRFTRNRGKLTAVMDVLAGRNLFFIDSRTTTESVAFELARSRGIPSSERTLFLDDANDPLSINQRFQELLQTARDRGEAVGICHFRPRTIAALQALRPDSFRDIHFTFASEIVR